MRNRSPVYASTTWSKAAVFVGPILLAGCATPPPMPFDEKAAHYVKELGANAISGKAVMISKDGYTRTCQDDGVYLLPVTPYWASWVKLVFESENATYAPRIKMLKQSADDHAWSVTRHAECDSAGHFRFSSVPDGKYYIFAKISWLLRWQQNGGELLQIVDVRNAASTTIDLIQDWRSTAQNPDKGSPEH